VSGSNFNPRNTQCIPAVKIFAFLELKQKIVFFKGLNLTAMKHNDFALSASNLGHPKLSLI